MGITASARFRSALSRGDERSALEIWRQGGPDFWDSVKPNESYGSNYDGYTPFLYSAKYGLENFISRFMNRGADVRVPNAKGETAIHLLCSYNREEGSGRNRGRSRATEDKIRQKLLDYIFEWKRPHGNGEKEIKASFEVEALDKVGESALHKAAKSGLKECMEVLLAHGASLFVENKTGQTPCDCAEQAGLTDIAEFLETKMVFSESPEAENGNESPNVALFVTEEDSGLRTQDVQEVKDKLLVETSDMLGIPLFTAEALLRNHGWNREALLDAWMEDAAATCEQSGVHPPTECCLVCELGKEVDLHLSHCDDAMNGERSHKDYDMIQCAICEVDIPPSEPQVPISCGHSFCRQCWESYLNIKIQEGNAHNILCPAQDCTILVPLETIERVVSKEMARRYLQFDIKAFVESNPNLKWCPYPGCTRVVRRPSSSSSDALIGVAAAFNPENDEDVCKAVDCGNGHYFCWGCGAEAHEPCGCEQWKTWYERITEMRVKTSVSDEVAFSAAANLWIVKNSKPCPNIKCRAPIQKNEGCNHMKCSKCKHEFCWVCFEEWKKHSSATGGYFKCNRYEAIKKVDEQGKSALSEASVEYTSVREVHRFKHFFERFENHGSSYTIEERLLGGLEEKFKRLAKRSDKVVGDSTKFMEDAVHELLKARRILRGSYALGYFLDAESDRSLREKVVVFELMQNDLEVATEQLSQMVNRLYLKTPRGRIISSTRFLRRKRHEFLSSADKEFIPPDRPGPWLRDIDGEDSELFRAIEASLRENHGSPAPSPPPRRFPMFHNLFVDSDNDREGSDEHISDDSESGNPLLHVRQLMAMIETLSADMHIGSKCARDGCIHRAVTDPTVAYNGYCSDRCCQLFRERERQQFRNRRSLNHRVERNAGRQQERPLPLPRPRVPQRRPPPNVDDSPEVTPVTKHQGRQSDRAQSQLSQQSRQHHHHVSVSESDSSNVSTPETVRTSRVVGRRKSAVSDTGNRGTPAVPSRLNSSVDGELELALAMSRQSATRDSRVPGSTKPTRVETKQASHDSAPPERDGDLELALRLSLLGSCLEGIDMGDGDMTDDADLQHAIQLSLAESAAIGRCNTPV